MGNNTSTTSTRRSTAGRHAESNDLRVSEASRRTESLDEEFSDLILHQVKPHDKTVVSSNTLQTPLSSADYPIPYNQFSNDLIEDEFNELNDGLIETEATILSRNIIPNNDDMISNNENQDDNSDAMEIDQVERAETPTPDINNVDFTKISDTQNKRDVKVGSSYSNIQHHNKRSKHNNHDESKLIPVEIKWVNTNKEQINKISIIGTFSNWRDIIKLLPSQFHDNEYVTTINLPLGVHKLLYIINNEYRVSEQLPTATDQEGIFFNWFEVIDESHLFNHSLNQPNHTDASTLYDANIIVPEGAYRHQQLSNSTSSSLLPTKVAAGKHEVDMINRKSNSFLTKITKEWTDFEHVEYLNEDSQSKKDLEALQHQQQLSENYPYKNDHSNANSSSNRYVPYGSSSTSSSFQRAVAGDETPLEYSSDIPEMFVNYNYFKDKSPNYELPEPPQLPAHLNNVLLNKISNSNTSNSQLTNIPQLPSSYHHPQSNDPFRPSEPSSVSSSYKRPPLRRADSSYYASNKESYHQSIPNHVILNHLMTTSIRNDVLTVACITRYSGKFVTQIMHSPADT